MPIDPSIPQCQHIKVNGLRCGSPSLKGRRYCYFHYEVTRQLVRTDIPVLEDAGSVQYSLNRLAEYILEKRIDYKQASLLLWLMQIASANARHARLEPFLKEDIVREHPEDSFFPNAAPHADQNQDDDDSEIAGPEISESSPVPSVSSVVKHSLPQDSSASSASSAVNPLPSDAPRKAPTRQELAEASARAIEKFRNTPPFEEAVPVRKNRRRSP
ncbi:MAG: hypothetical protein ACRD2Y_06115 [Terriglobales bacterium]